VVAVVASVCTDLVYIYIILFIVFIRYGTDEKSLKVKVVFIKKQNAKKRVTFLPYRHSAN